MDKEGAALVQGASRGIGLEIVRQLLERDAARRVFATCRSPGQASALTELEAHSQGRLAVLQLDLREEASMAVVYGDNGLGHLAVQRAAEAAMDKAETAGVG